MGRPKGGANREWTAQMKMEVLNYHFSGHYKRETLSKYSISSYQFETWKHRYLEGGIKALENKRKPGNPLLKYSSRKTLSELEQKEYEIMKLRIENERLKKGYTEADVILAKKKSKEKNSK